MSIIFWILIFLFYSFQAYCSKQANNDSKLFFYLTWFIGFIPFWALVAKHSKNLIYDGMLYDFCILISYILTFILLGCGENFNKMNWIGLILIISGFALMRIK